MYDYQWIKKAQPDLAPFIPNKSFYLSRPSQNIHFSAIDEKCPITIAWTSSRKLDVLKDFTSLAQISLPLLPSGTAQIQISQPDKADTVSLRPLGLINIDKWFVYDSAPYVWEIRSTWTMRHYSLFKFTGNRKVKVGCFKQVGNELSGLFSIDTRELDEFVGLSTFITILRGK